MHHGTVGGLLFGGVLCVAVWRGVAHEVSFMLESLLLRPPDPQEGRQSLLPEPTKTKPLSLTAVYFSEALLF